MIKALAALFYCLATLLTGSMAWAAELDDIINAIPTQTVIRGRYIQTQKLVHVPHAFTTEGHFIFWRDSVFLWRTNAPIRTTTLYTDKSLKTYLHINGKRIESVSSSATSIENRILWSIISRDLNALELDFQILAYDLPQGWQLDFYPKTNLTRSIVKHVIMLGRTGPRELIVENYSGDLTILKLFDISLSNASSSQEEAELANP